MKIVVELDGWTKFVEVDERVARSGHVEIPLHPPMDILIRKKDLAMSDDITVAIFKLTGRNRYGMPIFKYRPS